MSEYTPSVEERRQGAKAIEAALNQCGIAVRYAISGPSELFDVASVLLKSDFMAAHDRAVVHEAAEAIRHHATAPTELVWPTVQIDRLVAWVADWIENPPDWVAVSYRQAVPVEPQQKASE